MNRKIFVNIASFLDPDVKNTILDCYFKAKNPENLVFGICLQYDLIEETSQYILDDLPSFINRKIIKFHYTESQGGCWARNKVQQLYESEYYHLQVDSHFRFRHHWDDFVLREYENLKNISNKPIISFLGPSFLRNETLGLDYHFDHIDNPTMLNVPRIERITQDYWPHFQGYTNVKSTGNKNRNVSILYCGFVFSEGSWVKEVMNDPEHYYTGEEFALSIRSFTHGYDIFLPTEIIAWHLSSSNQKKHFKIFENNSFFHNRAMNRLKMLIEGGDLGRYGLGTKRSLLEYEKFAKINLKERKCID